MSGKKYFTSKCGDRLDYPGGGYPLYSYNSLYGEAPPERGTFFRLQVYKRVGISQVEVYEGVGKCH